MEKNKNPRLCGICNRSFANGKAMGGHMRSHLLKLKLPLSPPTKRQLPTHSPTTRRSKRLRNSYSPSLSAQDAAICLLMLSRDHSQPNPDSQTEDYTTYESLDAAAANNGGAEDTENDELCSSMSAKAHPKYYKCETCNRSFRSHQALGGHRASHSLKNKQILVDEDEDDDDSGDDDRRIHHQQRLFECPFCDKVFQSGQALGGHKKVHFAHLPVGHQDKPSVSSSSTLQLFDLNLPASTDDDDDDDEEEEEAGLVANSAPSIYEQSG